MSIELKEAAQQVLKELGEARKIVRASSSRQLAKDWDRRATDALANLRTAIQQAEAQQPATGEPVLTVEREPDYWSGGHFHKGDKPHINPMKVWSLPIGTKLYTRPVPSVRADVVRVPLQVLKDASEALGNFVSDHGWGDTDMQAMDNLDAYIARHEAIDAAMLAAK